MEDTTTTWQEGIDIKEGYPQLSQNIQVDAVIIGAGITGATSAYLLSKTGLKVALIEAGVIGRDSATAYTTAMISYETDTSLSTLVDTFGEKSAKLAWEAGRDAIRFIGRTVKREKINCEFVEVDSYSYTLNPKDLGDLEDEIELADRLGFDVGMDQASLGFEVAGYEKFTDQAKFHPIKYIKKLIEIAHKNGVEIFENSEALKISEDKNGVIVSTKKGNILAKDLIMATYSPFTHPLSMYFKAGKYKTYVIEARIKRGQLKEGIYESWENPYHYFRIDPQGVHDRIIIGGEDHREDIPVSVRKSFTALEEYLQRIVGKDYKIIKRWTGPILEPVDGLPYIGKSPNSNHQYITHGFSGTGMTFGTVAAILFRDLILGETNKYEKLFNPNRLPTIAQLFAKGKDYTQELIGGAVKNTLR